MKIITFFFLAVSFCCFQDDTSTKEIIEKANRIRAELLHGKSLPPSIIKPEDFSTPAFKKKHETFIYYTTRKENNSVDSLIMNVTVYLEDSLEHILSFNEVYFKDNKTYMYKINKHGIIDWAYHSDDPEKMNLQDIEIMTDSAIYNYDPIHYQIKKPAEKTMAFYTAKLIVSLEELERILFLK